MICNFVSRFSFPVNEKKTNLFSHNINITQYCTTVLQDKDTRTCDLVLFKYHIHNIYSTVQYYLFTSKYRRFLIEWF